MAENQIVFEYSKDMLYNASSEIIKQYRGIVPIIAAWFRKGE